MATLTKAPEPAAPHMADSKYGQQIALETEGIRAGVVRYRRMAQQAIERGDGSSLKPAERFVMHWLEPMIEDVRQEQRGIRRGEPSAGRHIYGPVLLAIDADRAATIALHECLSQCMKFPTGVLVSKLAYSVGSAIIAEIGLDILKEKNRSDFDELTKKVKRLTPQKINRWTNKHLADPVWNRRVCVQLGARLLWSVQTCCSAADYGADQFKLAFRRKLRRMGHKHKAFFIMDSSVYMQIEQGHGVRQYMRPQYLPMIVEPMDWRQVYDKDGKCIDIEGGFLQVRTTLITKPIQAQKKALLEADLSRFLPGLNYLNKTQWAKSDPICTVIDEIQSRGGGLAGIPRQEDHPMPDKPVLFAQSPEAKKEWRAAAARMHRENVKLRAARAETEQTLSVMDMVQNHKVFWFFHKICFRGRAYPMSQYLNHHGNDMARAMLRFAKPKDASKDAARYWIYVHAANCAGHDKISYEDRVNWVANWIKEHRVEKWIGHAETIVDVAAETWAFDNKRDPRHIDNPLQFLAALLAICDPSQAATLPVQRDGTANALQHYAGLSLDPEAAAMVNMIDGPAPADPYTAMVKKIKAVVELDASKPGEHGDIARLATGFLLRSVLKRPGMTRNYGVTMVGARSQIADEIQEIIKHEPGSPLHDHKKLFAVSAYLAKVAMKTFDSMCHSAEKTMRWLQDSARSIAQAGHLVRIDSPLGLPVIQPYRKARKVQVFTCLQKIIVAVEDSKQKVMVQKQSAACPPNTIHMFDETHQYMTAMECQKYDITLGAVHDCDWTHAATVMQTDQIRRDQFIVLHSENWLERIAEQWRARYPGVFIGDPPARGSFDLNEVAKARYFFS